MHNKREPLLHISKRGAVKWYSAWLIRLAALVLALLNLGVISSIQSLSWGAISGFFLAP